MNIRPQVEALWRLCQEAPPALPNAEEMIGVSVATKRIASAYERFRNTLEADEEDILRRKAIWRILVRRLMEDRSGTAIATALLQELVRAHYVASITRYQAERIGREIDEVRLLREQADQEVGNWFLRLVAVSIDRELYPRRQEEQLVHLMYHDTYRRTVWTDDLAAAADRPQQLYIGCHRALFAADDYEISYHYFLNSFSYWKQTPLANEQRAHLVREIPRFYREVERLVNHPARQRIMHFLRPVAVPYRILRDVCREGDTNVFEAPVTVATATQAALTRRSNRLVDRMTKRARHSVVFLLVTKTILAFLIELPYELFLLGRVHWLALGMNTIFHPLLLLLISTWTHLPGARNTERLVEQLQIIASGEGELPTIVLNASRRYGPVTWSAFAFFYTTLFFAVFWGMFVVLNWFDFSLLGMLLFVTFLGLVAFLSARVRRSVDEIRVVPKKDSTISVMSSFLALPILEFGGWLTRNISQINVVLFIMDRIFEAPFKLLIDVIEEWFTFVRDRREEIV